MLLLRGLKGLSCPVQGRMRRPEPAQAVGGGPLTCGGLLCLSRQIRSGWGCRSRAQSPKSRAGPEDVPWISGDTRVVTHSSRQDVAQGHTLSLSENTLILPTEPIRTVERHGRRLQGMNKSEHLLCVRYFNHRVTFHSIFQNPCKIGMVPILQRKKCVQRSDQLPWF